MRPDDPDIVREIVARVPGATDAGRVASLLRAWWAYAEREAAQGAVVDSARFLDEREAAGLLELPRDVAERAIERELALLRRSAAPGGHGVPAAVPVSRLGDGLVSARRPAGAHRDPLAARRLQVRVTAGIVAFLALLVALAVVLGSAVPHLGLPGAGARASISPWRAWLAVLVGVVGAVSAVGVAVARPARRPVVAAPGLALGGLALAGFGLLSGVVAVTVVGGATFVVGGLAARLRASTTRSR